MIFYLTLYCSRPYPEGGAYPCGNTVCQSSAARWNTNLLSGYEYAVSVGNNRIMKQFEIGVAFRFEGESILVVVDCCRFNFNL